MRRRFRGGVTHEQSGFRACCWPAACLWPWGGVWFDGKNLGFRVEGFVGLHFEARGLGLMVSLCGMDLRRGF